MSTSAPPEPLRYETYLALERERDQRHEFLAGRVFAMAGGTPEHAQLAAAVIAALRGGLGDQPCAVFTSDLKLRIDTVDVSTYADAVVVCGALERSPADDLAATNPRVVVEVTSPSSEAYDRGEKFSHYRHLASLEAYVVVAHDREGIDVFERLDDGWRLRHASAGQRVPVDALDLSLDVDAIYRDPLTGGSLAVAHPRR